MYHEPQAKMSPLDFNYLGYFFLRYSEYKKHKEASFQLAKKHLSEVCFSWSSAWSLESQHKQEIRKNTSGLSPIMVSLISRLENEELHNENYFKFCTWQ